MKNIISEIKNALERINSRLDKASDLGKKVAENTQSSIKEKLI